MKFMTVLDYDKFQQFFDNGVLQDNSIFEFSSEDSLFLNERLEDLTGNPSSFITGVCYPNNYNLSKVWKDLSKLIPIAKNDIVMEFSVEEDECIYSDVKSTTKSIYLSGGFQSLISYDFKEGDFAYTKDISVTNFEDGVIVDGLWDKQELPSNQNINSSQFNNFANRVKEKYVNISNTWR